MKHHLVTLACTAAGAIAALAAGLLLGPSPAEQPLAAAPQVVATEAKGDRLPFALRFAQRDPEAPRPVPAAPATLPVEAVSVPLAPEVAQLLNPAPGPILEPAAAPARHEHTVCDRYGMHKVWYGRGPYQRWRCRR
jgi:hypothetical protein